MDLLKVRNKTYFKEVNIFSHIMNLDDKSTCIVSSENKQIRIVILAISEIGINLYHGGGCLVI